MELNFLNRVLKKKAKTKTHTPKIKKKINQVFLIQGMLTITPPYPQPNNTPF